MLRNGRETAKNLGCSPIIGTFFGCGRPVCKNTQLSAKKCTRARSHCLFASVNPQKIFTRGNIAWQHLLVYCISPSVTTHHLTLSSVSCCFPLFFALRLLKGYTPPGGSCSERSIDRFYLFLLHTTSSRNYAMNLEDKSLSS